MKVIISMSGLSSRFSNAGYTIPKFMIDIDGKKVIEHIIDLYPKDSDFLFIINDKHAEDTDIINLLENGVDKKKNETSFYPSSKKLAGDKKRSLC